MTVDFYNNQSDIRYLDKNLTLIKTAECQLYDSSDIDSIRILLEYDSLITGCNFFKIPDLGRAYYVTGMMLNPGNNCMIQGKIDVLETYHDDIKNISGIVNRQEHAEISLLPDSKILIKNDTIKNIYSSNETFTTMYGNYILSVLGGV